MKSFIRFIVYFLILIFWAHSTIFSAPKLRLYLCKKYNIYTATLPELCDLPETSGSIYEWQSTTVAKAIYWGKYYLPYDIKGDEFTIHIYCAENSSSASRPFTFSISINSIAVLTKTCLVSDNSYKTYPSPFLFKSDSVISARAGDEVKLIVLSNPVGGPGYVKWGTGVNSYIEIPGQSTIDVNEKNSQTVPTEFALSQNFPNPFNPETTIKYQLPEPSEVTIRIFNITGQVVKRILEEHRPAGYHSVLWDGKDDMGNHVTSGVYFYQLCARTAKLGQVYAETRKMVLVR